MEKQGISFSHKPWKEGQSDPSTNSNHPVYEMMHRRDGRIRSFSSWENIWLWRCVRGSIPNMNMMKASVPIQRRMGQVVSAGVYKKDGLIGTPMLLVLLETEGEAQRIEDTPSKQMASISGVAGNSRYLSRSLCLFLRTWFMG
jgi:hypothetical protein